MPYDLRVINMKAGEQRQSDYLAINPLDKVPMSGWVVELEINAGRRRRH